VRRKSEHVGTEWVQRLLLPSPVEQRTSSLPRVASAIKAWFKNKQQPNVERDNPNGNHH